MASVIESTSMGGYITSFDTINFSTSKQKYSFSKDQRFPGINKKGKCQNYYELPDTKQKRAAGFGVGQRFKTPMAVRQKSPDAGNYTIASNFDIGKPGTAQCTTKKGIYSFGIGRKNYKHVYLPENPLNGAKRMYIPGPGTYDSKIKTCGYEGQKWKIQGRTRCAQDPENIMKKSKVPAPGTYGEGVAINSTGRYPLSTTQNSRAANWSPSKNRFDERKFSETPGPGGYSPSDYNGGVYLLSNFKNHGTHTMKPSSQMRRLKSFSRDQTPGPGTYMPPSDFGYLEIYKFSPRYMRNRSVMGTRTQLSSKFSNYEKLGRGNSKNSTRSQTRNVYMNTTGIISGDNSPLSVDNTHTTNVIRQQPRQQLVLVKQMKTIN